MKADLLKFTESGGCSSKIPAGLLENILKDLPVITNENVLVDISTHDDAGVYKISDDLALVLTTDFFPPVCSDPYEFGQIAAANSISDVYAMGGKPVVALNIMMFPASKLEPGVYSEIIRGGSDKATEAGVIIIGGHTIDDSVPKYGLAVTGFIHPQKIITNAGARPGDVIILTKPVGTGTILAGHRLGLAAESSLTKALEWMKMLNKRGGEIMSEAGVRGATDITGFGLAGHALKMAKASNVTISLIMNDVPLIEGTYELINEGCIPGASFRNLEYCEKETHFSPGLDYNLKMIAFDAQTSGGLFISVNESKAESLLHSLHEAGLLHSRIIGKVTEKGNSNLILL